MGGGECECEREGGSGGVLVKMGNEKRNREREGKLEGKRERGRWVCKGYERSKKVLSGL